MTRPLCMLMLALLALTGCIASSAPNADAKVAVGVGEQDVIPYGDSPWKSLGLKRSRIVIPYDVARKRGSTRAKMDAFYRASLEQKVELLVAFNPTARSRCPRRPCRVPSVRTYTRAFRSFRKRYPRLRVIAPVNEANHNTQPTARNPRAAARFYNVARRYCRGCKIVAADVIDEANMVRWVRSFRRYARRPRIWGLHNYKDTNPRKGQTLGGTRRFLRTVRRGQVWLTETGGIVTFRLSNGRTLFPTDEARAQKATGRMFDLARKYRRRISRLYIYHWRAPATANRFDAGLIRRDGTARPAFDTLVDRMKNQGQYFGR